MPIPLILGIIAVLVGGTGAIVGAPGLSGLQETRRHARRRGLRLAADPAPGNVVVFFGIFSANPTVGSSIDEDARMPLTPRVPRPARRKARENLLESANRPVAAPLAAAVPPTPSRTAS